MSLETNYKILIGSISNTLDKRLILGDTFDKSYLNMLLVLVDRIDYCLKQYEKGVEGYTEKIITLTNKLNTLKYKCPSVCVYKDKLIIRGQINTAPTIEDNIIRIPFSSEEEALEFRDVVYNFTDNENDYISKVVILSEDSDTNLFVNKSDVILNYEYNTPLSFSISYKADPSKKYLIKNVNDNPCTANIIEIDRDLYEDTIKDTEIVDIHSVDSKTIFQKVATEFVSLPNETVIYTHIDTTSMGATDQETIKDAIIAWYTQFKIDNPSFAGSLLINTTDNQDIDTDYAPGRGGGGNNGGISMTGLVKIEGSNIKTYEDVYGSPVPQEYWLQNPAEGLLRQAWKEGVNFFVSENEFYNYISGKSLVVLSFVDESNDSYHGNSISYEGLVPQPSSLYRTDYYNFINKVRPYLTFFKGVLYPVTNPTDELTLAFLLQAISAIEAKSLGKLEVDEILQQDKVSAIGVVAMEALYNAFATSPSPYEDFNLLKSLGWTGNFVKVSSESGDNFDPIEFSEELDDLLTNTDSSEVSVIKNIEIDSVDLGNEITTSFSLKVKDNNINPLYSNNATISVEHYGVCEEIPICSSIGQLTIGEEIYQLKWDDFNIEENIDKIVITSVDVTDGALKYFGIALIDSALPVVVTKEDIDSGKLNYVPNNNSEVDYSVVIDYKKSYVGLLNTCTGTDRLQLDKNENANQAPIITVTDLVLELESGVETGNGQIIATIIYTGSGNYSISWEQVSGPSQATLVNPTEEVLNIENLIEGVYEFTATVITEVNGFTSSATSTVEVAQNPSFLLFGASPTELAPTSSSIEITAVLDSLQQTVGFESTIDITCTSDNNDNNNFTYIAIKTALGEIINITQQGFGFSIIGAFENLGETFLYDDGNGEVAYTILKTNATGAFADQTVLTLTFN